MVIAATAATVDMEETEETEGTGETEETEEIGVNAPTAVIVGTVALDLLSDLIVAEERRA